MLPDLSIHRNLATFYVKVAGVLGFAGYFKNLAYKIFQAELIIFARFVYTSQTIFKHSEQTTYDTYLQV